MSHLSRVAKVLRANTKGAGITVGRLAQLSGLSKTAVYKRVSDLRNVEGHRIFSNYRNVNGQRKMFYRFAD
jgi:predicted transcriptional regulator